MMTLPPDTTGTPRTKLKVRVPVVARIPETKSPATELAAGLTATMLPPRAVRAAPAPALSTIKLLAEEVEAVTVKVGEAERSAGPLELEIPKPLEPLVPTNPPFAAEQVFAGVYAGVVQETWGTAKAGFPVAGSQVHTLEKQGKLTALGALAA